MRMTTISAILVLVVCTINLSNAAQVGTGWTYQGRLMDDNNPGEGVYDFQFKLFDNQYTGTQQGSTVDVNDLDVIDGYFTVELDFGSDVFDSDAYWLEIDVRPGGTADPFITLSPRQEITPTPYAMQTRGIFVDDMPYIVGYPDTWTAKESTRGWHSVAMSADGTKQTAVVYNGRIYVSTDSGNTWTPKESYRWWYSVAMSADGTIQTAVAYAGQIYVSTDSGNTWTPKESNRYWRSVAMSADGTKQTAVGLQGQIYVSTDSGNTWTAKESNRDWHSVAMSADGTIQTAVGQNTQIYVSTDSGNTWTAKGSNRNWSSVAMSADGIRQTAVVVNGLIYVSQSYGDSWMSNESNRAWYSVAMSADGARQTAVVNNGQVYVSQDWGYTWTAKESNRAWYSVAISADGTKQTAVVDQGQIYICSADMSYSYNVGIGTTNPQAKLDVRGSLSVEDKVSIGTTNPDPFIKLHISGSEGAGLLLENLDATSKWSIGSHNTGYFSISESYPGSASARLFIDPGGDTEMVPTGGNVGIGTNPVNKLDVEGAMAVGANYSGTDTAPTNGMIIEGNVGIGTTNPDAKLDVVGSSAGDAVVVGHNTGIGYGLGGRCDMGHGVRGLSESGYGVVGTSVSGAGGYFSSESGPGLVVEKGSVGIGTTNPDTELHISGSDTTTGLLLENLQATSAWKVHSDNGGTFYIDQLIGSGAWTRFKINPSGNTALALWGGNVGIGTNAPAYKLDVAGPIRGVSDSDIAADIRNSDSSGVAYGVNVIVNGEGGTHHYAGRFQASGATENFAIYADGIGSKSYFEGNVGIGTKYPAEKLHVNQSAGSVGIRVSSDAASYQYMNFGAENGYSIGRASDDKFFINRDIPLGTGAERILTIQTDGNVGIGTKNPASSLHVIGCVTASFCSDIRLKKSIEPLPSDDSILDRVMGLQAVTFEWKHRDDGKRQIGLIAQDVEEVFPEVVTTPEDDSCEKGLLATGMDAVLVEAIKELKIENELLKDRIRTLEKRMDKRQLAASKEVQ
ncbi:MAG: hypothetical protein GWN67_01900 [Phycisphaerae bacterium]|nr:hypothetical protein [Phycisphaerae bacterium]NIR66795.1 hypothetical protein [candidate division Zixibacteria bacterium]NIP52664.1 hypothetical protein [Phycisphaerae bacterium]NIS49869.1 hypothetical protein [Phycisphaerae bacterium]NIU07962.1 hypothetical protein [Phycisphaerae bacterium]